MTEEQYRYEYIKLKNEVNSLKNSMSWKITRPCRYLGRVARSVLRVVLPGRLFKGLRILYREGFSALLSAIKEKMSKKRNAQFNNASTSGVQKSDSATVVAENLNFCKEDFVISFDLIKNCIHSENIKVVSFDIFDTLLTRPTSTPTDIFRLLEKSALARGISNFFSIRANAEKNLGNENASFDDIYNFIQNSENISADDITFLKQEELKLEFDLLYPRKEIMSLYKCAVECGKKVVATSDMYLSSAFLKKILHSKGYEKIETVYVSNEFKKRKSNGTLFLEVVERENQTPDSILHLGDNLMSDYYFPLKTGITAFYVPSSFNLFKKHSKARYAYNIPQETATRIVTEFTITKYAEKYHNANHKFSEVNNIQEFVELCLNPLVLSLMLSVCNNKEIQSKYSRILFASRDGFLPKLVYDILNSNGDFLPSKYIYAGRRAYGILGTDNVIDYVISGLNDELTFEEVLKIKFYNKAFLNSLELSDEIKSMTIKKDKQNIVAFIKHNKKVFCKEYDKIRLAAFSYYKSIADENSSEREIAFDCGYSGSISENLSKIFGKKVDKLYLYQTQENISKDKKNGTRTITLLDESEIPQIGINIVYEELFSPLEGGCVGFSDLVPIFEDCSFSQNMIEIYDFIKDSVTEYTKDFFSIFKNHLGFFDSFDFKTLQDNFVFALRENDNWKFFDEIRFPDPCFQKKNYSLTYKVCDVFQFSDVFEGTGFSNKNLEFKKSVSAFKTNFKIGIHLHLFNEWLGQEFLGYFVQFPVKFDLYVTVAEEKVARIVENIFNPRIVPNCNNLKVIVYPNRGRDIAPWILGMRQYQTDYDLFCHIQSKVSNHFGTWFGNNWRKYLVKNLISKDAFADILSFFESDEKLGCIFPAVFEPLKQFEINNNIRLEGMYNEIFVIHSLLERMDIHRTYSRANQFFSQGSMYWYRPKAFSQMFTFPLELEEFPVEPIGVGGTIAHAFERLPAFVCEYNGYRARTYTPFRSLT